MEHGFRNSGVKMTTRVVGELSSTSLSIGEETTLSESPSKGLKLWRDVIIPHFLPKAVRSRLRRDCTIIGTTNREISIWAVFPNQSIRCTIKVTMACFFNNR